jgi:hypothetical protein
MKKKIRRKEEIQVLNKNKKRERCDRAKTAINDS